MLTKDRVIKIRITKHNPIRYLFFIIGITYLKYKSFWVLPIKNIIYPDDYEGSATYTQKLMVDCDLKFLHYQELKELYVTNHVFDEASVPLINPEKYPVNYYMYSAFIIDAYIQEYGLEAMHKVYLKLKELNAGCEGRCYSHKDIIKVMIEASGKPITDEDILYPYKKHFLTNKSLFLQKVEPLVKGIYCYGENESASCSAPSDNW